MAGRAEAVGNLGRSTARLLLFRAEQHRGSAAPRIVEFRSHIPANQPDMIPRPRGRSRGDCWALCLSRRESCLGAPQVLLKVLGAQSRHVRARRHVRALRRSCLESLQKSSVCSSSMSSTVPPSQLLAGRVMLSVATALLLSAAASVMGAAPPPPPNCASPCSLSHAPPVPDKPVGLAAGEVAPMPPAVSPRCAPAPAPAHPAARRCCCSARWRSDWRRSGWWSWRASCR